MKIIDYIATAAAIGVFGYFMYRVIVPKLADLKLPVWQPPPPLQFQQPQQQQQPKIEYIPAPAGQEAATTPPVPAASPPPVSEPEEEEEDESTPPTTKSAPSSVAPPPPSGQVLYDSSKGWTGVTTAASGSPKWTTEAGGIGKLSCGSGHCRVYIAVKNHNARMEGEYMYSGAVDNLSLRLRSRHQEGGACENRFGGYGAAIQKSGEVEFQTESCHNEHENSISGQQSPAPQAGKWYKFAFSCYDSPDKKSTNFKLDIDGKTVLTGKHPSPKPYFQDEALHMKNSYIWLRSNNSGNGSISFRNFRVTKIGAAANFATTTNNIRRLMIDEPYLFNGYRYGRRQ